MAGKPIKEEDYEAYLQERCRIMLKDFLMEFFASDLTRASSFKEVKDFIENFMKKHNLK